MKYKIIFTVSADKQLKKLAKTAQKLIVEKVKELNISKPNNNVKKLVGVNDLYRLRIGDYRVIYQIRRNDLIILVLKVGHRKDIYRDVYKL